MKFELAIETSVGVEDRVNLIVDLSNKLTSYFLNKDYGNDVREIIIRVISVAPEFEWFSTLKKPRYRAYSKSTSRDGIEIVEDRLFSFSLKIDYESFKNQSDDENKKMLASAILDSLSNLDALPKKVNGFDKERFKEDVKAFFDEQR